MQFLPLDKLLSEGLCRSVLFLHNRVLCIFTHLYMHAQKSHTYIYIVHTYTIPVCKYVHRLSNRYSVNQMFMVKHTMELSRLKGTIFT